MPLAITLCFDSAITVFLQDLWRALADENVDCDRQQLGYAPHVTLAIYPDDVCLNQIADALAPLAQAWDALPVTLAGYGVFPGINSILWAIPVVTSALLRRQQALLAALPDLPDYSHYHPNVWVPHVTLSGPLKDPTPALSVVMPRWQPLNGFLTHLQLVRFRPVEILESHHLKNAIDSV